MLVDGLQLFLVEGVDLAGAYKRTRLVWARNEDDAENCFRQEADSYGFPSVVAYAALEASYSYDPDD